MPSMRRSLRRTSAALLSAALVLVSCTSDGGTERAQPSPTVTAPTGSASRPLRFGVIGAPATLDPYHRDASDLTYTLARPVYPSLYRFLPSGIPRADLAQEIVEKRHSAVVRLAPARWSDGRPITARDVVASAQRARSPSGFAEVRAEAIGRRTVRFTGPTGDWEERLATLAFVLPRGRAGRAFGGPFRVKSFTTGYELVLERNPRYSGPPAETPVLKVRFVQDLDLMLLLLENGDLDAAAPLSTVNLDQRLEEHGFEYDRKIGWEEIWIDFSRSPLNFVERASLLRGIDWDKLEKAYVRSDGELELPTERGGAAVVVNETLIGSGSDELVSLLMRGAWFQLRDAGHRIELLRVDPDVLYGRWGGGGPPGTALRRVASAPDLDDPLGLGRDGRRALAVATYVTWRPGIEGPEANPTLDGPLWNAEDLRGS